MSKSSRSRKAPLGAKCTSASSIAPASSHAARNHLTSRQRQLDRNNSTLELMSRSSGPLPHRTGHAAKGSVMPMLEETSLSGLASSYILRNRSNVKRMALPGHSAEVDGRRPIVAPADASLQYSTNRRGSRKFSVTSIVLDSPSRYSAINQASRDGKDDMLMAELMDGSADHVSAINKLDVHCYAPLHHAARYGYLRVTSLLLDHGAFVDIQGDEERTPLYLASKYNHSQCVEMLLEHGADKLLADVYGLLPIHVAARRGHCQVVEVLLSDSDIVVNACDNNGMTPLHHSCASGSQITTQLLLNFRGDVFARTVNQETPYHLAALDGHHPVLKLIIDNVTSSKSMPVESLMRAQDGDGNTCLHLSALNGHTEVVSLCLDTHHNINMQDVHGSSPLHLAALNGHLATVQLLCDRGADIHQTDNDLMTALHRATMFDRREIVTFLLEMDPDLLQLRDKDGLTPMLLASSRGYHDLIALFHSNGGDLTVKDSREATCLHLAALQGSQDSVKCLLELSGRTLLNEVDRDEASALHLSAQNGYLQLCRTLVSSGIDLTIKDEHERLALHWAARNGKLDVCSYLVEKAPTYVNAADDQGRTSLHLAAIHGHHAIVSMLLKTGADATARDCGRWTPLCHASRQGSVACMRILLDNDTPVNITDANGNHALSLAAGAGHVEAVELLLDRGASARHTNNSRMTCLDIAIFYNQRGAALALLEHGSWREMMSNTSYDGFTPMKRLIELMPDVAELVLDRCVKQSAASLDKGGSKVTYDFRYVSDDPSHLDGSENVKSFHAMEEMVKNGREKLLSHPVSQALLQQKWDSFGKVLFLVNLFFYILFVISMTVYVTNTDLPGTQAVMNANNSMFEMQRLQRYLPVTQVLCDTDYGGIDLVYLSGHLRNTSVTYQLRPCNRSLFSTILSCPHPSKPQDDINIFSATNDSSVACPKPNTTTPFLLACPVTEASSLSASPGGPAPNQPAPTTGPQAGVAAGGSVSTDSDDSSSAHVYSVYEIDHLPTASCADHRYNTTCLLDPTQLGVLYSSSPNPEGQCDSPYLLKSPPPQALVFQIVVVVFILFHITKELIHLVALGADYFALDFVIDWLIYGLSLVAVWPGLFGEQPNGAQWRCGAIAVVLIWINLLVFVQRFSHIGIYVVMFRSVLKTFVKVFLVFSVVLIGFSIGFYILFSVHDNFNSVGISILQTCVMMLGEVEFLEIFISNVDSIQYRDVTYAIYAVYIILVPIVMMNLLVGLAVGDIETVKRNALLKRLAMQVHMISNIERRVPQWYRQHVYQPHSVVYPNIYRSNWQLFWSYLGQLINMNSSLEINEQERSRLETEKTNLAFQRQGQRLEALEEMLQSQNHLLRTMVEKLQSTEHHSSTGTDRECQSSTNTDRGRDELQLVSISEEDVF